MLRVQLFGPVDRKAAGQTELRAGFLPPSNIGTEMRQLFPGVRMARSPYYVQNRYGPFGYAVGRSSSGDTCLYAWQRLTSTGPGREPLAVELQLQLPFLHEDELFLRRMDVDRKACQGVA